MELAVIPARTDEHIDKVQHIGNSRRIAAAGGVTGSLSGAQADNAATATSGSNSNPGSINRGSRSIVERPQYIPAGTNGVIVAFAAGRRFFVRQFFVLPV